MSTRNELKVSTIKACAICGMDDYGSIANESIASDVVRQIRIRVLGRESRCRSTSMLSTEVTDLTSGRVTRIAGRHFAAIIRIKMAASGIAVAISWNGKDMNVICCFAKVS
jgi:hypothetical protein